MPEEPDESQWWLDDKIWLDIFGSYLSEDPFQADRAARLFHRLVAEIESGEKGTTRAAICLENALRLTFPFTNTGRACMILFRVSLGKNFPPRKGSLAVLSEATKRTKAALKRGPVSQKKPRKRSRRK